MTTTDCAAALDECIAGLDRDEAGRLALWLGAAAIGAADDSALTLILGAVAGMVADRLAAVTEPR
ncbi:MAG TPA: hypothetical protein VFH70_01665 [Acidimicrobiales bacterium]|nr:hypothetical protein [Acidimicrobiales bacterium]